MKNPYEVLGVPRDASASQIRKKFRKLAMRYHPDRNRDDPDAVRRYRGVVDAYEVLSDPDRRRRFDETGATDRPAAEHPSEILNLVVPVFLDCLQELSRAGKTPADTDVLKMVRQRIESHRGQVETAHGNITRAIKHLTAARGRFELDGSPDNVLNEVVESKVREVTVQLNLCKDELDRLTRTLDFLKRCKYRLDGESGPDLPSFAGGFIVCTFRNGSSS